MGLNVIFTFKHIVHIDPSHPSLIIFLPHFPMKTFLLKVALVMAFYPRNRDVTNILGKYSTNGVTFSALKEKYFIS